MAGVGGVPSIWLDCVLDASSSGWLGTVAAEEEDDNDDEEEEKDKRGHRIGRGNGIGGTPWDLLLVLLIIFLL